MEHKDKYINMMSHICDIWKIIQMNLFIKQKWTHRQEKKKDLWLPKGKQERRDELGVWD